MKNLWRRVLGQFRFTSSLIYPKSLSDCLPIRLKVKTFLSICQAPLVFGLQALFYASNSTDLLFLLQGQQSFQDGQSSFIHHIYHNFVKLSCVTGSHWDVLINNIDTEPFFHGTYILGDILIKHLICQREKNGRIGPRYGLAEKLVSGWGGQLHCFGPQQNYNEQRQKREKGRAVGAWSTGAQWLTGLLESARGGNRGRTMEEEADWMNYARKMREPWKPNTYYYLMCIINLCFI